MSSPESRTKKKRHTDKAKSTVVHQDSSEKQLEAFQDKLITRLSVIFCPPIQHQPSAGAQGSSQSPTSGPLGTSGDQQGTSLPPLTSGPLGTSEGGVTSAHTPTSGPQGTSGGMLHNNINSASISGQHHASTSMLPSPHPPWGGINACQPTATSSSGEGSSVPVATQAWDQPLSIDVPAGPLQQRPDDGDARQPLTSPAPHVSTPEELPPPRPSPGSGSLVGSILSMVSNSGIIEDNPQQPPSPMDSFRGLEDLTLRGFAPALSIPRQ